MKDLTKDMEDMIVREVEAHGDYILQIVFPVRQFFLGSKTPKGLTGICDAVEFLKNLRAFCQDNCYEAVVLDSKTNLKDTLGSKVGLTTDIIAIEAVYMTIRVFAEKIVLLNPMHKSVPGNVYTYLDDTWFDDSIRP